MSLACLAQSAQPVTPNFFARLDGEGTGCGFAGPLFLGTGADNFESTALYFGTGASPVAGYALNMHHQNPKLGKPDLVEVDSTGVIFTLINETK